MSRALMLVTLLAGPALAHDSDFGAIGADPSLMGHGNEDTRPKGLSRMGLAVSLVFDTTTWVAVGVSSDSAHAATRFIKSGHYRLELLQLVLIAQRSGGRLLDLTKKRGGGATLRSLAEAANLSYDEVYSDSELLAKKVNWYLESTERVRSDRANGKPRK